MSDQEQYREYERYQEWAAEKEDYEEHQYHVYLEGRIAELEAKHQWQPIETAPKNLTEILGYRCDAGVFVMVYGSPEDMMTDLEIDQVLKEEPDADWLDIEDWFCYMQDGSIRLAGDEAPTHWMPLPEPPENQHE